MYENNTKSQKGWANSNDYKTNNHSSLGQKFVFPHANSVVAASSAASSAAAAAAAKEMRKKSMMTYQMNSFSCKIWNI